MLNDQTAPTGLSGPDGDVLVAGFQRDAVPAKVFHPRNPTQNLGKLSIPGPGITQPVWGAGGSVEFDGFVQATQSTAVYRRAKRRIIRQPHDRLFGSQF